jgi:WD40 repeat protein
LAAAGSAGLIRLLRLDADNQLHPFQSIHAHATPIFQVAFHPSGQYLASASEGGEVRLWDVETRQELLCLLGHTQPLRAVTFHPNGKLVASSSDDETVRLWAVDGPSPSGDCVSVLRVPGPYTNMNIAGAVGITPAQRSALLALGAVETRHEPDKVIT